MNWFKVMRSRLSLAAATLIVGIGLAATARADSFFYSSGTPNGLFGATSRPASLGKIETETADDFVLTETTVISRATIIGLIPPGPLSNIGNVEVEVYQIFPLDSDVTRTSGPPTFSTSRVPTRVNSPADVEIPAATRDGSDGTLGFVPSVVSPTFAVANSVVSFNFVNDGPKTGQEVEISINFTTPIILPAGHYFFRPEVLVTGGDFLYLSAPKLTLLPGTTTPDLQAWYRDSILKPDWARIGTDILHVAPSNMTFSLSGDTVPAAGTPGQANCHGKTVSALARQFGGTHQAFLALGASSVDTLQDAIKLFCGEK